MKEWKLEGLERLDDDAMAKNPYIQPLFLPVHRLWQRNAADQVDIRMPCLDSTSRNPISDANGATNCVNFPRGYISGQRTAVVKEFKVAAGDLPNGTSHASQKQSSARGRKSHDIMFVALVP